MSRLSSAPTTNRHQSILSGPASARVTLDGRELINFVGAGYLALGGRPELREAALKAIEGGTAFSSQVPATYGAVDAAVRDVERRAAEYCGTEDAVYMPSGYFIGAAALTSLDVSNSVLFIDQAAHFSLLDAAKLTTRPVIVFRHADPEALAEALRASLPPRMRPVVVTDGVFATIGRVPPLDQYAVVLANYDGRLVVDEAHSFGVLGLNGRGAADYHRVERIATSAGTLSKAFCAQGAIIGCSVETADKLRRAPPLRGANAGSPISAAVGAAAIRYAQTHPEHRARLAALAGYLRSRLKDIGIDVAETPAPIVAFRIGDVAFMHTIQTGLFEIGIYVLVSNYIGAGEGIIRCALFADHTEADLDALVGSLSKLLPTIWGSS